jgi:hypothetical protein
MENKDCDGMPEAGAEDPHTPSPKKTRVYGQCEVQSPDTDSAEEPS